MDWMLALQSDGTLLSGNYVIDGHARLSTNFLMGL